MVWRYGQLCGDSIPEEFGAWVVSRWTQPGKCTFHRSRYLYDLVSLPALLADRSTYPTRAQSLDAWREMLVNRLPNGLFFATHGGHNAKTMSQ